MNDYLKCFNPTAYKLYDEIVKTHGEQNDYVWKKALIDFSSVTETSIGNTSALDQITNGARCFPMGIPCIAYLNGDFYGIFSWQLKKHRDNYHMDKKNANHVHLDGDFAALLTANGDSSRIDWTGHPDTGFETRNPKNLYLMNGTKYDADTNPGELMDETSQYYDSTNKDHKRSVSVKNTILNLSKVMTILADAYAVYEASNKTTQDIANFKAVFETYFDVDNLIDYLILCDVLYNYDGFSSNWQWFTYDGVKWYIGLYDADLTFGNKALMPEHGFHAPLTNTHVIESKMVKTGYQCNYIPLFYNDELEQRYAELRKLNIISVNHIIGIISEWISRLGNQDAYSRELERWSDIREPDSINRVYKWLETSVSNMDNVYHYNQI